MSLFIASLNSGSNGNCYYIGSETEAILVDAGISCKETEKRMKRLGLSMDKVKAIFVSHEHSDHITGIPVLARKYQLPVYITQGTQAKGRLLLEQHLVISFRAHVPIQFGGFSVTAFPKFHDACDPHSFIVASASVKVGIFTDIGIACDQVIRYFQQCHAAFLEANYDEDMLTNGSYPSYLKKRIKGGTGHLSNAQALQLVLSYKPRFMSHLLLSHLSKNNNNPELVEELFSQHAENTKIIVASRNKETPVYYITNRGIPTGSIKKKYESQTHLQLSLF
jgi:phosphoribosyl 1,2-cyclic phosphodiesterase